MRELHAELHNGQGLGNQLWVILSCIGLAERHALLPVIYGIENFKAKGFLNLEVATNSGPSPARQTLREQKAYDRIYGLDITRHDTLLEALSAHSIADCLNISGDLQSMSLLPKPLNRILSYVTPIHEVATLQKNQASIHVRGGDYSKTLCQVSQAYYKGAISFIKKSMPNAQLGLVTDDPSYACTWVPGVPISQQKEDDQFDELRAAHHMGSGIEQDFLKIYQSDAVIISSSTFSFWPALLSKLRFPEKVVIAPAFWYANRVSRGWWSLPDSYTGVFTYFNKHGQPYSHNVQPVQRSTFHNKDIYPPARRIFNLFFKTIF
jgi:hypothetical protein